MPNPNKKNNKSAKQLALEALYEKNLAKDEEKKKNSSSTNSAKDTKKPVKSSSGGSQGHTNDRRVGGAATSRAKEGKQTIYERTKGTLKGAGKQWLGGQLSGVATAAQFLEPTARGIIHTNYKEPENRYNLRSREDAEYREQNYLDENVRRKEGRDINNARRYYANPNENLQNLVNQADELMMSGQEDIDKAKEGAGALGKVMIDLGANAAQMTGDMSLNYVLPGLGMLSLMNRAGGGAGMEGRQIGMDVNQQMAYAAGTAMIEGLSEGIFNSVGAFRATYGKGAIDLAGRISNKTAATNIVQNYFKTEAGQILAYNLAKMGGGMLEEGTEEIVAGIAEPALKYVLLKASDPNQEWEGYDWKELGYDFMIGAMMGGMGGSIDMARNTADDLRLSQSQAFKDGVEYTKKFINEARATGRLNENGKTVKNTAEVLADQFEQQINEGKKILPGQARMLQEAVAEQNAENDEAFTSRRRTEYQKAVSEGRADTVESRGSAEEETEFRRGVQSTQKANTEAARKAMGEDASKESAEALGRVMTGSADSYDHNIILKDQKAREAFEKLTGEKLSLKNTEARDTLEKFTSVNEIANRDKILAEAHENIRTNMGVRGGKLFKENYDEAVKAIGTKNAPEIYESVFSRLYSNGMVENAKFEDVYDRVIGQMQGSLKESVDRFFTKEMALKVFNEGRSVMYENNARKTALNVAQAASKTASGFTVESNVKSKVTRKQERLLASFAEKAKVHIHLVDSIANGTANGAYKDGVIYIAADASNKLITVAKHELTHHLKATSPARYQELEDFVFERWYEGDAETMEETVQDYQQRYNCKPEEAREEIIADAAEKFFTDRAAINDAIDFSRSLGKAIHKGIRSLLNDFLEIQKSDNKKERGYGDFLEDLDILKDAEEMWLDALNESTKARESKVTTKQQRVKIKHSIKEAPSMKELDKSGAILETESGEPVAKFEKNGSAQFSLKTYEDEGRAKYKAYLRKMVKAKELSEEEAFGVDGHGGMYGELETIYRISRNFADSGEFAPFTAWSEADVKRNAQGKSVFSSIRANSEYKMNIDFSTICKKRRTLDAVFRVMINRGLFEKLDLNMEESAALVVNINNIIRTHDFEAACALCFVEARRYRQQQTAKTFANLWNDLVESMYKDKSKIAYFNYGEDATVEKVANGIDTLPDRDLDLTYLKKLANEKNDEGKLKQTAEAKVARLLLADPSQRKLLRVGDMMASTGFENMQIQNPKLMSVYNSKKGTGGAKSSFGDVQYLNEIIGSMNKTFNRKAAYAVSGVRLQSFSDYVPRMVFDYVQVVADLAAKRLPAHAYTKEVLFVKQFGLTGIKINMSLVPDVVADGIAPGLDKDGNYIWNKDGTFPWDDFTDKKGRKWPGAKSLLKAEGYKKNCGTIAVGISDEQIIKMLKDKNISQIIPYHKSSLNPIVAAMTNVDRFVDYTNYQNTRTKDGAKVEKEFDWDNKLFALSHGKDGKLLPESEWGDVQELVQEYVDWCNKNEYVPKFSQFLYDEKGNINEGYYKLLSDFALFDNEGNFIPQDDVRMNFPTEDSAFGSMEDLIKQGLSEDTDLEARRKTEIEKIVDEIEVEMEKGTITEQSFESKLVLNMKNLKPSENERYKYSKKEDSDGNKLTENQVNFFKDSKVRDKDGKLLKMYHGTYESFNVFKANEFVKEQNGLSKIKGYFSSSEEYSRIYGDTDSYYLNIKNPLYIPDEWKHLDEWEKWFKKQGVKGVKFDSGISEDGLKGYGFEDGTKGYALWDLFDTGDYWYGDGNLTEAIEKAGYDGIYWNEGEGWNVGNGKFIDTNPLAYMPFNENAIKRTDNLNPTDNEDIRYSRKEDDNSYTDVKKLNEAIWKKNEQISVERWRAEVDAQKIKNHYNEVQQAKRERREESETRTKLLNIARRLSKIKTNDPTRKLIDSFIGDLDLIAKSMTGKSLQKLYDLSEWYDEQCQADAYFYDENIEKALDRVAKKQIADMDIDDVRDLIDILKAVETSIRNGNKFVDSQYKKTMREAGLEVIKDVDESVGIKRTTVLGKLDAFFINGTLSPERQIRRVTGYKDDDPMYIATKELSKGQRDMLTYQMTSWDMFKKFTSDKNFVKSLNGKNAREIVLYGQVKGENAEIKVTPDIAISLYLSSLNKDNMYHIGKGGVNIPDFAAYRKGNLEEAYDNTTRVTFSKEQLERIRTMLTAQEREFTDKAYEYYNKVAPDAINEVSNILKGYSLARVNNYFPINVDQNFLEKDFESLKFDGTIEGMGSLKERVKSGVPIEINGIVNTLTRSIQENSMYVGLAIPVRNFNKLLGVKDMKYTEKDRGGKIELDVSYEGSVNESIRKKWGKPTMKYIEKFMTDLQTNRRSGDDWENMLNRLRSNYAGAVLTLNLSVAMKQAASYPTAIAVLGTWPAIRAMGNFGKVDLDLIAKYTPLQWYRSQGYSVKELGDIKAGRKDSFIDKVTSKPFLNWIQAMDVLTTRKLWKASEYYVRQHNKNLKAGTDDYYKVVAEVYNRVIEETQPNYTVMQRPDLLRADSFVTQTLNMFKTQPYQNFNILYDSVGNYIAKAKQYKGDRSAENKAKVKEAYVNMNNAVWSQFLQLATFASMTFAWAFFRGKDDKWKDEEEDKVTLLSFLKRLGIEMTSGSSAMIPLGADIYSLLTHNATGDYYSGFQSITDSSINDLFNTATDLTSLIGKAMDYYNAEDKSDIDTDAIWKQLEKVIKEWGRFAGVPAQNMWNLFDATYRWVMIAANGKYVGEYESLKQTLASEKVKKQLLLKAYNNDIEAYREIRQRMIEDGFDVEKLNKYMGEYEKTELYDAYNNDSQRYEEIRSLMLEEGYTEEDLDNLLKKSNKESLTEESDSDINNPFSESMASIEGYDIWNDASDGSKEYYTDILNKLSLGIEDQKTGYVTEKAINGLTEEQVILYKLAVKQADAKNDGNGSYKKSEKEEALRMLEEAYGITLTEEQKEILMD